MIGKVVGLVLLLAVAWLVLKLIVVPIVVAGLVVLSLVGLAIGAALTIGVVALLAWGLYAIALRPLARRALR